MSLETALSPTQDETCRAHDPPSQRVRFVLSCSTPSFHIGLNLPNLNFPPIDVSPLALLPRVTQQADPPAAIAHGAWRRLRAGRGTLPGGAMQGHSPLGGHSGCRRTPPHSTAQLGQAHSTARAVLAQSRAKLRQDSVTSGHAAVLLCSQGNVGWGFFPLFLSPFCILTIWKPRAELIPTPHHA